jgi:DNA-binding transcriptional regulator YbjK
MKLEKIELQTKEGDYVLCTLYVDVTWDVDEYAFELEGVTVKGVSYPELHEVAQEWMEEEQDYLRERAEEDARNARIAWEESR